MAACTVFASIGQIGVASAIVERNCMKQILGSIRFASSSRIVISKSLRHRSWRLAGVRAQAREGGSLQPQKGSLEQSTDEGEGVSLGIELLPPDADLKKLESLLFQFSAQN